MRLSSRGSSNKKAAPNKGGVHKGESMELKNKLFMYAFGVILFLLAAIVLEIADPAATLIIPRK